MNQLKAFLFRGFAYKGFQCQRCDCVLHRECYDRCVHPCQGKKGEVCFHLTKKDGGDDMELFFIDLI